MKFYTRFAACYGTIWLVLLLIALISGSHINAGQFGLFGFPIISLLFAIVQGYREKHLDKDQHPDYSKQITELEEKINQIRNEQMIRESNRSAL